MVYVSKAIGEVTLSMGTWYINIYKNKNKFNSWLKILQWFRENSECRFERKFFFGDFCVFPCYLSAVRDHRLAWFGLNDSEDEVIFVFAEPWFVLLIGWSFVSTNQKQVWVVTPHQFGISTPFSQTSYREDTTGGVAKCRLFSQATLTSHLNL